MAPPLSWNSFADGAEPGEIIVIVKEEAVSAAFLGLSHAASLVKNRLVVSKATEDG
jgi:hypothetical protein